MPMELMRCKCGFNLIKLPKIKLSHSLNAVSSFNQRKKKKFLLYSLLHFVCGLHSVCPFHLYLDTAMSSRYQVLNNLGQLLMILLHTRNCLALNVTFFGIYFPWNFQQIWKRNQAKIMLLNIHTCLQIKQEKIQNPPRD